MCLQEFGDCVYGYFDSCCFGYVDLYLWLVFVVIVCVALIGWGFVFRFWWLFCVPVVVICLDFGLLLFGLSVLR